ncbi:MAG TPA: IS3 family transposase, partial [Syntrophobacteraceae bacterium]|nr:IS3 family transposase [Syntrophobacteraceae bacterium]
GISRSGYYYEPAMESPFNLMLMRLIDEHYTRFPFYGSPRMTAWLRSEGYGVNHKRVERLMRQMGIQGVCPRRNLSKGCDGHRKYPYLLAGLTVDHPNQVWCSDITYIRLVKGFVYLVAIMDWYSRFVLSWEISNTLDTHFCMESLERALLRGTPEIFNTDQGVQFTSAAFTSRLLDEQIRISMDGRGRAFDNIFIERLWRSVKYEEVYLKDYETVMDAVTGIGSYLDLYNHERLHPSLGYRTPAEVYGS